MKYEIEYTAQFGAWLTKIKNSQAKARIAKRIDMIRLGNFGDHKSIAKDLYELRFFFGPGYRVYYTIQNGVVVIMLCGGNKSRQDKDIEKAKAILAELE